VGRATRRVAAEKKKEKKDAEKARAHEQTRAQEALESRRRRQERDGLPREPSPETPDDDDDDDEDDNMEARLGLSPNQRLGQGSPSQPPSGLAPSVSGAGTSRSRSEEWGQAEGVLDPLAEVVEVTPRSLADPPVPQEQAPMPAAQEVGPPAIVTTPGGPPLRRLGRPRWRRRRSQKRGYPRQRLRGPRPKGPPRKHDWPWSGAGKYPRIPLLWFFFSVCLDLVFSLSFSKWRQGSTGLATRKALKTGLASAAGVAAHHAGWLASAQSTLEQGAQAARVAMGQVPQANPSVGAAIVPEETADAVVAPSPPDLLLAPASTPAGAVADSPVEPPVASDVGMVEVPPLVVVPDLPVLGREERAIVVAEVGDRMPTTLAEGRPSMSTAMVFDVSTAGGPDGLVEGRAEPRPVLWSSGLVLTQRNPNEWRGQPLRFWSRGASEILLFLNDEREEQSRNELREHAEVAMRSLRSTMEVLSRDVPRVFQVRMWAYTLRDQGILCNTLLSFFRNLRI
jgi:hypothetical protein